MWEYTLTTQQAMALIDVAFGYEDEKEAYRDLKHGRIVDVGPCKLCMEKPGRYAFAGPKFDVDYWLDFVTGIVKLRNG
jgi:hypothetical protein